MPNTTLPKTTWIAAGFVVLAAWPAMAQETETESARIEAELLALREQIVLIRERLEESMAERQGALRAVANAERVVSDAERKRRETLAQLNSTEQTIDLLSGELDRVVEHVAVSASQLSGQLVLAHRTGRQSRLKVLLNQEDPRVATRKLAYHGYLSRLRLVWMEQLRSDLRELAVTRDRLADEHDRFSRLAEQQQLAIERLEQARIDRAAALAQIEQRVQSRREVLAGLERDALELSRLLDELSIALADIPPEADVPPIHELRGHLPPPLDGRPSQRFGESRNGELRWNGWLMPAAFGTDVQAIAYGRVAYADWLRGYGLILIMDHGDGVMSLYAHNEALLRSVGDWVGPGEVIASVGDTGSPAGSALYFELRENGEPVDPDGWMRRHN